MKRYTPVVLLQVLALAITAQAQLGQYYAEPSGGWTYAYTGTNASFGVPDTTVNFDALDGTWSRSNGSSSWDGSGLGGTIGFGSNAPGGASVLIEGDVTFLRVQDCGDPRDFAGAGFGTEVNGTSTNSNRKLYFGHDLAPHAVSGNFLDTGFTISFRARVPTSGLLDAQYPDTANNGENRTLPQGTAWQSDGNGYLGHDGGKGNFSIRQASPGATLSFSLGLANDIRGNQSPHGITGLVMNSLAASSPNIAASAVDAYDTEGTLNVLPMPSLTDDFHEFWIVIQADPTFTGTHQVDVYVDGCLTPQTYVVTAGTGNDYSFDYIGFGCGATPEQGAIDVDYYAFKPGIWTPQINTGQSPVGFSAGPVNTTGGEGGYAYFSVVATGGPPRLLTWQRSNGVGGFTNLPGCTAGYPTISVGPLQGTDNGAQFRCIVFNSLNSVTSSIATLTVDTDKVAPTVTRTFGKYTLTNITVSFSEPVIPATANVPGNYTADNGLSILSASLAADGTNVLLMTTPQTPGVAYTLTINNIRDTSFNQNRIANNTQASFKAWVVANGFLTLERYFGIPGNSTTDLTSNPKYPLEADQVLAINSSFVPQSNPNLDTYGGRLTGWIIAPATGDYTFHLRGDDDTELRLGTTSDPATLSQIIYAPGAGQPYVASFPQPLVAGQRYAIEAIWKEGNGGDYLQVAWSLPGSTSVEPLPLTAFEGYVDPTGASVSIVEAPQSQTRLQNRTATFTVSANVAPVGAPVNYIWQRDGGGGFATVALGGTSYTTPMLNYPADNNSQYRVIVVVPGASATSAVATLTVQQDTLAPVCLQAKRPAPCADTSVILTFDELLDPASATDLNSYEIVNLTHGLSLGALVATPVLAADGKTVTVSAAASLTNGALYKVIVKNAKDLALNSSGLVNKLITMNGALLATGAQNFVVVEAENYDVNTPRVFDAGSGPVEYYWIFDNTRAGFSGAGVMQNLPNIEGNRPGGGEGCSLDFCVNFPVPGTYYVWVRGGANDGAANSIHVGIDGLVPPTGANLQAGFDTAGYAWCGWINGGTTDRATIEVFSAGYHTVHIFMREDGFFADKLVVTSDAAFQPTGLGPDETPREQANVAMIQIIPSTLQASGTKVTFDLQTLQGLTNVVEYKDSLNDANWTTLTSFQGNGSIVGITNSAPLPLNRFYRARAVVP